LYQKISNSQRLVAGSTPAPSTWGKAATHRKEVGAEYPAFCPNLPKRVGGTVCSDRVHVLGCCCKRANINRLAGVQTGLTNSTLHDRLVLHICLFPSSCDVSWNKSSPTRSMTSGITNSTVESITCLIQVILDTTMLCLFRIKE
jgi:hypothetical protein